MKSRNPGDKRWPHITLFVCAWVDVAVMGWLAAQAWRTGAWWLLVFSGLMVLAARRAFRSSTYHQQAYNFAQSWKDGADV